MAYTGPVLVALVALAQAQAAPAHPSPEELRTLAAAKAEAGDDPAKLVKLALWCEQRGMDEERLALLKRATEHDPKHAAAHGLLGEVSYDGRWQTPEAVGAQVQADEKLTARLAEYNARRDKIERLADAERQAVEGLERARSYAKARELQALVDRRLEPEHVRLGLWCEQHGLAPEAKAELTTALHLNPHNEATWRHLGYARRNGRWMSHEQIAAEEHDAHEQRHADRHWEPLLDNWIAELRQPSRRAQAEEHLATVTDPRAVRSIVGLLCKPSSSSASQKLAVQLLGQIDAPAATKELAVLAVFSNDPEVRQSAAKTLKGRAPRDYGDWLMGLLHTPATYTFQPVTGVGSKGSLVVDSPRFHLVRTYNAPAAFRLGTNFHGYVGYDPNGLPIVMSGNDLDTYRHDLAHLDSHGKYRSQAASVLRRVEERTAEILAEANLNAAIARQRLTADVQDLEVSNAQARELNQRVGEVLTTALSAPTGYGDDEDAWRGWYYEQIGYRYSPPPKIVLTENTPSYFPPAVIVSCFAAGTPVLTLKGTRPIETIREGDRVLSQDVTTGALEFHPVLVVHRNPPDQTLRVALEGGDAVVASRFHRFWVAGRGWAMARDLKRGDVLRTLKGLAPITSIESAAVQPVFNLDVAETRTYFVGDSALLVHDNTLPPPHAAAAPFDRAATVGLEGGSQSAATVGGPGPP